MNDVIPIVLLLALVIPLARGEGAQARGMARQEATGLVEPAVSASRVQTWAAGQARLPDDGPRYQLVVQGPVGRLFEQGVAAYRRGEAKAAQEAFRLVIHQEPRGQLAAPALAFLAESLIREEPTGARRLEAIALYRELIHQFPNDPNTARAHWRVGDLYGELNQHAEAHAAYQLAFAALPAGADADRALLGMASNYLAWGKGPEAVQAFRHLKEQARSETVRAVATFGLADALHALKHEQEAYHWYEAGSRRWPTWLKQRPQSLVGFAEAARALGQRDRARDLLLLMINLYPRAPEAPLAGLALGDLLTETGARASAVLFYGEVMHRYPGSLAEAAAQVRLARLGREWARHTPADRSERGVGSGKTVDLVRFLDGAERRRVLRRVAEQYSDDRLASEALVELGVEWEAAGRWEEALRIYRELADRTGRLLDDPWPEVGKRRLRELVSPRLTQALKAQNDLDAVNLFQQYAVSATGESLVEPELLLKIAGAHRRLGFTAQAVKWYQALLQDPSARSLGEEALIGLGASYLDQDDPDAARQVFQRYRLQYPAGRWVAEAWQQLAVIALDKGEQAVAIDLARRWLVRFPQHPARGQVWLVLARALEGRAQLKEALEAYAQADRAGALSEHTPLAPATARLHYASLLFQVGRTDEAIRQLEGARRASTDPILSDWAHFELARALLAQHKEKQARTLLTALGESSVDELVGRVSRLLLKEDEQLANGGEAP